MADYNLSLEASVIDAVLIWLNDNYSTIIKQADLLSATGSSTTAAMTQKAITDALAGKADVFWATYGTTTYSEINAAYSAGNLVLMYYGGILYVCVQVGAYAYFISIGGGGTANSARYAKCQPSAIWSIDTLTYEITANKVTNLSSSSTNTQYPSAKAVYDALLFKANTAGIYPALSSGSADGVLSRDSAAASFLFRQAGGGGIGKGAAFIRELRGKSLVWNQLVRNGNFESTDGWTAVGTLSVSNNIASITPSAQYQGISQTLGGIVTGHKYLVRGSLYQAEVAGAYIKGQLKGTNVVLRIGDSNVGVWKEVSNIFVAGSDDNYNLGVGSTLASGWSEIKAKNIICIDLTLMFGAGHEPTSVAEFTNLGYNLPYYAHNIGSILNFKGQNLLTTELNQWDEEWELGGLSTTGDETANTDRIRAKNYIPCFPDTTYYFLSPKTLGVLFFDANKNFIAIATPTNTTYTTPANARFIRFYVIPTYGTTYNHDICINISGPRNGQYEPYSLNTLAVNPVNWEDTDANYFFMEGMRRAGSAYDYAKVDADGYIRKAYKVIAEVDLGNLEWNYNGSHFTGRTISGNVAQNSSAPNARCTKYLPVAGVTIVGGNAADKTFGYSNSDGVIVVRDSDYTDAAAFKTAMSGVKLLYELATPVEHTLDTPVFVGYPVDGNGTEQWSPENESIPYTTPCDMDVQYPIEAVSKATLVNLLDAFKTAGVISAYTMTYDAGTGSYTFGITR